MAGLESLERMKVDNTMTQVDHFVFSVVVCAGFKADF